MLVRSRTSKETGVAGGQEQEEVLKVKLPARSPEPTSHGEDLEEIQRRILSKGVMSSNLGFKRVILLNFILVFCYLNVLLYLLVRI